MLSNQHFLYWTKDVRLEEQRKLFRALLQFRIVVLKTPQPSSLPSMEADEQNQAV